MVRLGLPTYKLGNTPMCCICAISIRFTVKEFSLFILFGNCCLFHNFNTVAILWNL